MRVCSKFVIAWTNRSTILLFSVISPALDLVLSGSLAKHNAYGKSAVLMGFFPKCKHAASKPKQSSFNCITLYSVLASIRNSGENAKVFANTNLTSFHRRISLIFRSFSKPPNRMWEIIWAFWAAHKKPQIFRISCQNSSSSWLILNFVSVWAPRFFLSFIGEKVVTQQTNFDVVYFLSANFDHIGNHSARCSYPSTVTSKRESKTIQLFCCFSRSIDNNNFLSVFSFCDCWSFSQWIADARLLQLHSQVQ